MENWEEYNTKNGIITHPGKFEGEPAYTPYFYHMMLMGEGMDDGENAVIIDILPQDISLFPELEHYKQVRISWDSQGFVHGTPLV